MAVTTAEGSFRGVRARRIAWRSFTPADRERSTAERVRPKGVVTIVHGYGEHGGRYEHVAERLCAAGYAVYAPDHRGHGRSGGKRGRISLPAAVADLDQLLVTVVARDHPEVPLYLLGHSFGGALALRYCMAHQQRLRGLVLTSPLTVIDGGGVAKLLVRALGGIFPGASVRRIEPRLLSRDQRVVKDYIDDPLNHHGAIPAVVARAFVRHADTLPRDAPAVTLPTLLLWGTADRICPPAGAELLAQQLGAADLTLSAYPSLFHELLNEPEREQVLAQIVAWLDAHVATGSQPGRRRR